MHVFQLYPGRGQHGLGIGGVMVAALADYPDYAAVYYQHGAGAAGGHAAVEGRAVDGNAVFGGLADRVLLGVYGADAVGGHAAVLMEHFFELMPHFVAVGKARGRAYIAGNQELVVPGDNAA